MTAYVAYLCKDADSDYGIEFPDLPGCVTAGRSVEEARAMAAEALAGHVAALQEEGMPVPPPRSMDGLLSDPDREGAVLLLIDLDPDLLKPERVNVTLPRSLIHRIDAVADNRSRFLAEAAERALSGS